ETATTDATNPVAQAATQSGMNRHMASRREAGYGKPTLELGSTESLMDTELGDQSNSGYEALRVTVLSTGGASLAVTSDAYESERALPLRVAVRNAGGAHLTISSTARESWAISQHVRRNRQPR